MAFSLPVPLRRHAVARQIDGALAQALPAGPAAPASAAPTPPTRIGRVVIKKTGGLGAFLRPIGIAIGLVIVAVPTVWGINTLIASQERRALHDFAVVPQTTTVQAPVARQVADNEVQFIVRNVDGRLVRVIADKDAAAALVNDMLITLDKQRARIHAQAEAGLDQVFTAAFATRDADLAAYADWYFAWGQSWRMLYEASVGAVQEAFRLGFSQTQVVDAARHGVEDYVLRNYQDFVLKPGARDPVIVVGVQNVFADANGQFRTVLAGLDDELQQFVEQKAAFSEPLDADAVAVKVDWDSQKWRAPRQYADDHYLDPLRTVAVVGGSAVLLEPIVDRVALPLLARTTASAFSSVRMVVGGASVGSFEPGLGTAVGALAGLALDWGINQFQAGLQRGDFIKENAAALDATVAAWKGSISPEVDRAVDAWFDDLSLLVVENGGASLLARSRPAAVAAAAGP